MQFNGASASVTSATANQLVASVPAGATTGPISVTVGTQTATSAESFVVTSAPSGAPTISGFTPGGGAPGTAVTISGTNFDVVANDIVRFNDAEQASLTGATDTQITAVVPSYAGSGPISVRTPRGMAVSADDFIVPPTGYQYADIIARTRLAIDGASASLAIGTANKHGIVLFSAAAGDYLSLQISSLTVSPSGSVSYKIFDPKNLQVASGSVSTSAMSIHLPALNARGTYSILFSPGAATANLTFTLTRNPVLSAGQVLNQTIAIAGQSFRAVFVGTSGASVTMRMGVPSTAPANQSVTLTLYKDAQQMATASGSSSTDGAVSPSFAVPITGTYFAVVTPANAATGSTTLTLNPAMDLAIDGASLNVSTSTAGYQKRLLFSGTAGQSIGLGLAGLAYTPSGTLVGTTFTVYKPDGTQLATAGNSCGPGNPNAGCSTTINPPITLSTTGVYQIVLSPPTSVSLSAVLTASTPVSAVLASGTAAAANITRPGQYAAFTFAGVAGQPLTLRLAVASTTPANQTVVMSIWKPDGSMLNWVSGTSNSDGALFYTASLPASGTYSATVAPQYSATASLTVTLNPTMDFAIGGAPLSIATSAAGVQRRLLFNGTAGQSIGMGLTGLAYTPSNAGGRTTLTVYNVDGTRLATTDSSCAPGNPNGSCSTTINPPIKLPTTGVYQVVVSPPSGAAFSGTLTASTPVSAVLSAGAPAAVSLTRFGQYAAFSFAGTAGQALTMRLAVSSTAPAGQTVVVSIWKPDGSMLNWFAGTPSSDGALFYTASLPVSGTYAATVAPNYSATASLTLTVNPPSDMTVDGPPASISTGTAGNAKRYIVNLNAGEDIDVGISGIVHTPSSSLSTSLRVLKPDGTTAISTSCQSTGLARCDVSFTAGTAGPYTVLLTPPASVSFSGNITVSHRLTASLTVGGGAIYVGLDRDGQKANVAFSGTSGQLLQLSVSGMSTRPVGQAVYFYFVRPNMTTITSTSTTASNFNFNIPALDSTGTFYVVVVPVTAVQADLNVAVNPR